MENENQRAFTAKRTKRAAIADLPENVSVFAIQNVAKAISARIWEGEDLQKFSLEVPGVSESSGREVESVAQGRFAAQLRFVPSGKNSVLSFHVGISP